MAHRFSFRTALFALVPAALLGPTAGGCALFGQSGNSPGCAEVRHCLCTTNFDSRIRGMVLTAHGDQVELQVLEIPEPAARASGLEVGMTIGGEVYACMTPPEHPPGTQVWVFNYQKGSHDSAECPEFKACTAQNDSAAGYEGCLESERVACSAYADEAWRNGYLSLAVEKDGTYDFGEDPTGPAVIAIDEVDTLADRAMCDARFPPPPPQSCNDTTFVW